MFPNNPSYIEKLVQTKQDDILRELPDYTDYEMQANERFPIKLRIKPKIWVPIGLILAVAWLINVIAG